MNAFNDRHLRPSYPAGDDAIWPCVDHLAKTVNGIDETILVTGASGFLGGHFLYWWGQLGGRSVSLVRAADEPAARLKLWLRQSRTAASYGQSYPPSLYGNRALLGDVGADYCGIDLDARKRLGASGIQSVWHFAANLRYENDRRDQILADNVDGTRHALALAHAVGAKRFIHISTAYSCGRRDDLVPEVLHDLGGPFNNAYEESKCLAERTVVDEAPRLGIEPVILRPSIVVGPSTTWLPGGSDCGLYGLMNQLLRLKRMPANRWRGDIVVEGDPDARLHLLPVDYFVRDCLNLALTDFAGPKIRHIVPTAGPSVGESSPMVTTALGLPPIRVGRRNRPPAQLEAWLDRQLKFYLSYMAFQGGFARSLPAGTALDLGDMRQLTLGFVRNASGPGGSGTAQKSDTRTAYRIPVSVA